MTGEKKSRLLNKSFLCVLQRRGIVPHLFLLLCVVITTNARGQVACTMAGSLAGSLVGNAGFSTQHIDIVDSASTPIGGSLGTYPFSYYFIDPPLITATCISYTPAANTLWFHLGALTLAPGHSDVFLIPTSSGTIGVRVLYNGTPLSSARSLGVYALGTYSMVPSMGFSAQLIKLSTNMSIGIAYNNVGSLQFYTANGSSSSPGGISLGVFIDSVTNAPPPTCTVSNGSITIPLGNVAATAFPSVGSTAGSGSRNISLQCTSSPSVSMSLTGTAVSGYNNVLALTSGTGTAKGVGTQLLYISSPLTIGGSVSLGTAGSTLTVPISARYYRTGNVAAGTADTVATLNFIYQ